MNIYQRIRNFIYIWKWLLVKEWHYTRTDGDLTYNVCKLKPYQLEGMIETLNEVRKKKWYKLADIMRDRIIPCISHWRMTVGKEQVLKESFPSGKCVNKAHYTVEDGEVYFNKFPEPNYKKNKFDDWSGYVLYDCYFNGRNHGDTVGFEKNKNVESFHYHKETSKSYLSIFPNINHSIIEGKLTYY